VSAGRYAQITGWGMCVPDHVVTNEDLACTVETTDDWIYSHTGIRQRCVAQGERDTTASLATRAGRNALLVADLMPSQLDLVIVATVTPEYAFPATACCVQDALGASKAGAFDLSAGCSGFLYGLSLATHLIRSGEANHILIIGSETLSRITDWKDRNTCILFGDGAGAVVMSACPQPCGIMATVLGSDGSGRDALVLPAGGSHCPPSIQTVSNGDHFIKMNGREVFRFASTIIPKATEDVVARAGWRASDVALVVPHQANARIIEAAAKRLNLPMEKFLVNIDRYGNTSSASIPIALCEAIDANRIRAGDKLVLVGFGAGLTWAAAAIEWGMPMPLKPQSAPRRLLANARFGYATLRSLVTRAFHRAYNGVLGPEGQENWRGHLRERVDRWRHAHITPRHKKE